ncbi:MAG: ribosome small subunit-dependent GTPase A [Firmicutes bacterium]|nr:ribosome small subunit-dependent GTPase A [Bacillota bacterium]
MLQGRLVKAKGGFYFVKSSQGEVVRCRVRGRLEDAGIKLLVGDLVKIDENKKVITKAYPRKNRLLRPPVANIDQVVIVMSVHKPPLDLFFLDRLLVSIEASFMDVIICINKMDLTTPDDKKILEEIGDTFKNCGYNVVFGSAVVGWGIEEIKNIMHRKITVFAGPSGAGKSTLINMIKPELDLRSEPVSVKSDRGRHTTRHVELLELDKFSFVADTPGFQKLDLKNVASGELSSFFPEMLSQDPCKFSSCLHDAEPGCAIKNAVKAGEITSWRYEHYLFFLREIQQKEKTFFPKKEEDGR